MANIDILKSWVTKEEGFAKSNRFEVAFGPPGPGVNYEYLTCFCESISIPGKQITSFEYPFQAINNQVKVPNGYIFDDVTCVFLLTNKYTMKKVFDAWHQAIITPQYRLEYASNYERPVFISQLNEQNTPIYAVILENAFPISVGQINLSNTSTGEIAKLEVTFTFTNVINFAY